MKRYVRDLEDAVIRTLAAHAIEGERIEGLTGVWLAAAVPRKICSIGVHVSRWVTTHGYALNVDLDPAPFTDWITACGLEDAAFTTMARELGRPITRGRRPAGRGGGARRRVRPRAGGAARPRTAPASGHSPSTRRSRAVTSIQPIPRPGWDPLPHEGDIGVVGRVLVREWGFFIAELRFSEHATIHEHPGDNDADRHLHPGRGLHVDRRRDDAVSGGTAGALAKGSPASALDRGLHDDGARVRPTPVASASHSCDIISAIMARMSRTTIMADDALLDELRRIAKDEGVSLGKVIREALEMRASSPSPSELYRKASSGVVPRDLRRATTRSSPSTFVSDTLVTDTSVLFAALVTDDRDHERCEALQFLVRFGMPAPVVTETCLLAQSTRNDRAAHALLESVVDASVEVMPLEREDYARVGQLLSKYADTGVSFVDASVMAVAERGRGGHDRYARPPPISVVRPGHVGAFNLVP